MRLFLIFVLTSFFGICISAFAAENAVVASNNSILIKNVNIVDVVNNTVIENQYVSIEGDRIQTITSSSPVSKEYTRVIDAAGQYLMPGLIDMHVHVFQPADLYQLLRHGVTTARVMYGWPQTLTYRDEVSNGSQIGPDLLVSSPAINQESPYASSSIHRFVDTPDQARKLVSKYSKQGYDLIKTYDGLRPEIFEALSTEAELNGLKTAGHPSFYLTMDQYLKSNPQTIEHIEMLYQAWLDYSKNPDELVKLAKKLAGKNIPVTTTLVVYDNLARIAIEKYAFIEDKPTEYIHPFIKKLEQSSIDFITQLEKPEEWREKADYLGYMAKVLNANNVPLVVGSDGGVGYTINGKSTIDELDLLKRYGMPVIDILKAATLNPAKALNRDNEIGRVAEGFKANLLILNKDPRKNLSTLRNPISVIKSGFVFDSSQLAELDRKAKQHMNPLDVATYLLRAF